MMFTTAYTTFFCFVALLCAFAQLASAVPVQGKRDVFDPPILYPHAGTVWKKGQRHNVTWDISQAPKQITNRIGEIRLSQVNQSIFPVILATGFDILDSRIEVEVPWVQTGHEYTLVLFGDSGNSGPAFTIEGPSIFDDDV
ncbi:CsMn38 [Gelatoporia subvermispora B]|uniref:CsMn38 n=1 Tax=Ceriporiopsis subvermispora (strain B) TaxID=914234 RepID=M2PP67_CERS8|nr:CsMn38 [Gelatoporia subvermispora B]